MMTQGGTTWAKLSLGAFDVCMKWRPELERYIETNHALVRDRPTADLKCH